MEISIHQNAQCGVVAQLLGDIFGEPTDCGVQMYRQRQDPARTAPKNWRCKYIACLGSVPPRTKVDDVNGSAA